ncbi:uncharacterized protein LDX57_005558 [Aspergillus melleus]|uniref:uncharacterized protein n=1 Tax=Aspergillus melleus TaxID=138277 RepID=UPI001E8EE9C1|nr:uncharacterized protein LDX57_005558 [Aspergillus melleus]KAH8427853.1 hypothetical protein LDX57_005558 [Aspergillus melleus]
MPLDTAPSSFTTSDSSFSLQRPSRSPLRWVSRRLSRPKPPLNPSPSDDSEEERVTESYAVYCRAFTGAQPESVHLTERQSFDFLPVGAYGFTQLAPPRSRTPPPRVLTPSLYRASTLVQEPPRRPWWKRILCGS